MCRLDFFATFKKHRLLKKRIAPGYDFDSFPMRLQILEIPNTLRSRLKTIKEALPDCDINVHSIAMPGAY